MYKVKFLTNLVTEQEYNKSNQWKTVYPLIVDVKLVGPIIIPAGFIFDKNSVPAGLRWLFPVSGYKSDYAAAVHDWLYTSELFPRVVCDEIFYDAMIYSGVPKWRAWSKYKAVRVFGGMVWKKHTKESVDEARSLLDIPDIKETLIQYNFNEDDYKLWNLSFYSTTLN